MPAALLLLTTLHLAALAGAPQATPAGPAPPRATVTDSRTIVGQILSIDRAAGTLIVGESMQASAKGARPGETITLKLDGSTQLVRGKRAATTDELKARDHVVVRYVVSASGARAVSVRVADLVTATPSPAATAGGTPPGQN